MPYASSFTSVFTHNNLNHNDATALKAEIKAHEATFDVKKVQIDAQKVETNVLKAENAIMLTESLARRTVLPARDMQNVISMCTTNMAYQAVKVFQSSYICMVLKVFVVEQISGHINFTSRKSRRKVSYWQFGNTVNLAGLKCFALLTTSSCFATSHEKAPLKRSRSSGIASVPACTKSQ